jgi:lipopolysaccharide/colanic/teichoic acid biosynthesis glycosyltransferase
MQAEAREEMDGNGRGKGWRPMRRGTRDEGLDLRPIETLKRAWLCAIVVKPSRRVGAAAKRAVDIVVAAAGLAVLAPLLACIAILIRLDSPGPALYRQRRVGRGGVPFTMWKFRSMYDGSSQSIHHQASDDWFGERSHGNRYKADADPRVTPVGRYLRRTSVDELPQLWNVLVGDMSLVGPRPVMEYERCRFEPTHFQREVVRPGITGLWQVSGRDRLSARQMLELDVRYVRDRSFWFDLEILCRTLPAVLSELRRTPAVHDRGETITPSTRPQTH